MTRTQRHAARRRARHVHRVATVLQRSATVLQRAGCDTSIMFRFLHPSIVAAVIKVRLYQCTGTGTDMVPMLAPVLVRTCFDMVVLVLPPLPSSPSSSLSSMSSYMSPIWAITRTADSCRTAHTMTPLTAAGAAADAARAARIHRCPCQVHRGRPYAPLTPPHLHRDWAPAWLPHLHQPTPPSHPASCLVCPLPSLTLPISPTRQTVAPFVLGQVIRAPPDCAFSARGPRGRGQGTGRSTW